MILAQREILVLLGLLVQSVLVLLVVFGVDLSDAQTGAILAVSAAVLGLDFDVATVSAIGGADWPDELDDSGLIVAALAAHTGEVERNPYHLLHPGRMMDNVMRGSEVVGGQGGAAVSFDFAINDNIDKVLPFLKYEFRISRVFNHIIIIVNRSRNNRIA